MFVLHDDENAAFDSSISALMRYGGRVVALENNEARNVAGVDPNRIFGDNYPQYTAFLESMINPRKDTVIAVHTNSATGGDISLHNYPNAYAGQQSLSRGELRAFYDRVDAQGIIGFNHGDDPDNMVWMASRNALKDAGWAQGVLEQMLDRRMNAVFENVGNSYDGSMSNWAAYRGYEYVNVEGQDGSTLRMGQMLDGVFSALGYRGTPLSSAPGPSGLAPGVSR